MRSVRLTPTLVILSCVQILDGLLCLVANLLEFKSGVADYQTWIFLAVGALFMIDGIAIIGGWPSAIKLHLFITACFAALVVAYALPRGISFDTPAERFKNSIILGILGLQLWLALLVLMRRERPRPGY